MLSAIPCLSLWIFSLIWSHILDWAKSKGWLSTTGVRKLSNGVGIATQDFLFPAITFHFQLKIVASLLPALCFIGVSFAGCDRNLAMALMTLGTTLMAGMYCGFYSNHIDIASNYAGTLMAICNTSASITGFLVPVFVGELTHRNVRTLEI